MLGRPLGGDGWYRDVLVVVLAFGLLAGAAGGLWLTLTISEAGSMLAIPDSPRFLIAVNAVARTVIAGWFGLFLLAALARAQPGWNGRMPWSDVVARGCYGFFGACVLFNAIAVGRDLFAERTGEQGSAFWAWAGALAALGLAGMLALVLLRARARAPWPLAQRLAVTALVLLVLTSVGEAWYQERLAATRDDPAGMLAEVRAWQFALRTAQLHGVGLCGLLALALLTRGAPPGPAPRRDAAAFACLLLGVLGEVAAWLAYQLSGKHVLAALLLPCWLLSIAGAALVVVPHRLWRARRDDAASWFIAAALAWLALSFAMLLAWRGYHVLRGVSFSHAWMSAFGQAAAVGFLMQMQCGLIGRTVPLPAENQVGPFALINAGLLAQVMALIGTDWHAGWSTVLAGSGGGIALGLAWWIAVAAVGLRKRTT